MPLSDLTPEQQQAFHDRLKELGMDRSQVVAEISPRTHQGPVYLSPDPEVTAVKPHILTLSSIAEVKRLAGNADADFESGLLEYHHPEFPEWPVERNGLNPQDLTPEENRRIVNAEIAYVYGHSGRVASYRNIIDRHKFPAKFAAFAVEDICLDASNSPLVITAESLHVFGTVTICQGGSIRFEANATVTVQRMVKSDRPNC